MCVYIVLPEHYLQEKTRDISHEQENEKDIPGEREGHT